MARDQNDASAGGGEEQNAASPEGRENGKAPRRRFSLRKTVALVGLMGAGKSTIGRALAQALGVRFRDADREIERAAAMPIPEIFERFGEPYFREGERRVISRLLREPPHVLATGGGAYMDDDTRRAMKERARTIWLRADLETLTERCTRRGGRPLLKGEDPRKVLQDLMDKRYPVYAEADIVIDSRAGPHEEVVSQALAELNREGLTAPIAPRQPNGRAH